MSEPDDGTQRWLDEGGHEEAHVARSRLVAEVARAGTAQRADLWATALAEYGEDGASRIWQEALASEDASDT